MKLKTFIHAMLVRSDIPTRYRDADMGWQYVFPNAPTNAVDTLTLTLWGEARGESFEGKKAVAEVILNRSMWKGPSSLFMRGAKPEEICTERGRVNAVCLAKSQFSCWKWRIFVQERPYDCSQFDDCKLISKAVLGGDYAPSLSSLYYHADYIDQPSWAKNMKVETKIGRHIFYLG